MTNPNPLPPVLDHAYLDAATGGDGALEREVLALFLKQADSYLAELAATADEAEYRALVHKLKGAARGIGAARLADSAARAETAAADAEGRGCRLESLRAEFDRLAETIARRLSENLP